MGRKFKKNKERILKVSAILLVTMAIGIIVYGEMVFREKVRISVVKAMDEEASRERVEVEEKVIVEMIECMEKADNEKTVKETNENIEKQEIKKEVVKKSIGKKKQKIKKSIANKKPVVKKKTTVREVSNTEGFQTKEESVAESVYTTSRK